MPVVLCIIFSTKVSTLVCHLDLLKLVVPFLGGLLAGWGIDLRVNNNWKRMQRVKTSFFLKAIHWTIEITTPPAWNRGWFFSLLASAPDLHPELRVANRVKMSFFSSRFSKTACRWRNSSDGTGLDLRKKPGAWCNDGIQIYTVTEGRNSSW